jgi:ABC-type branched-subunit amino acid transport system substrate-binding protein
LLRARPLYTEELVRRAIVAGLNANGSSLDLAMPHFQMSDEQLADLVAYLKVLGRAADTDPGLGPTFIRVGTVLPLTGPLASIGQDIHVVLQTYFEQLNKAGGIYGRRIELVVVDSGGEVDPSNLAVRKLINQERVFALLASYLPNGSDVESVLIAEQVSLIAPLSFTTQSDKVNRYRFDILPSFANQARCLVNFAYSQNNAADSKSGNERTQATTVTARRYAVIYGDGAFDLDAAFGFHTQIKALGIPPPTEFRYHSGHFSGANAEAFLKKTRPDYVFFFGASDGLETSLAVATANNLPTRFLSTTAMASNLAFVSSKDMIEKVWLAQTQPPSVEALATLMELEQKSNTRIKNRAIGASAYAAAEVFIEAVKRSGRKLSRSRLIDGLESLRKFETGFVSPITFGPHQRAGTVGCIVMHVDPQTGRYVPLTGWIALDPAP